MNKTNKITSKQAQRVAKLTEEFFHSVLNPWDFDEGYPDAKSIYKDIVKDPEAVRDYVNDIVSEYSLDCYEAGLATEILSALCKATGEEYFC